MLPSHPGFSSHPYGLCVSSGMLVRHRMYAFLLALLLAWSLGCADMQVFSHMVFLSSYFGQLQAKGKRASEIYETVQHAGNVLPRLYLMATAAVVLVESGEVPVREVLKDLQEMCKGVQHPTRGLFVRYYVLQSVKDRLPERGSRFEGRGGSVSDALTFLLDQFVEMTRLWCRLESAGEVKSAKRRARERRELRMLAAAPLEIISNMEGVDPVVFAEHVLPAVLDSVLETGDPIAQAFLVEAVAQAFPVAWLLPHLGAFLATCGKLATGVNVRVLFAAILDRLVRGGGGVWGDGGWEGAGGGVRGGWGGKKNCHLNLLLIIDWMCRGRLQRC